MKQSIVTAILVVMIIIGSISGYVIGFYVPHAGSVGTSSSSLASTSVGCTVSAPTEGVVIQLVENNYTASSQSVIPIVGASIIGQAIGYCNNQKQVMNISKASTNSTGWASLLDGAFGVYYLSINFNPSASPSLGLFNLSIITQPTAITKATFNLSSGNLTTHLIYLA